MDFPIQVKVAGGLPLVEDGPGAANLINLKPFAKGLKSVLAPRPIFSLAGVSWPFPQLIELEGVSYVCTPDSIYKCEENTLEPLLTGIPNAGYPWSGAVLGDFRVFVNNKVVVTGRDSLTIDNSGLIPTGLCIVTINGQLIIGAPWCYGKWHKESVIWSRVGEANFTIGRDNVSALRYAGCGTVLNMRYFYRKTLSGMHPGFVAFGTDAITTWLTSAHPAMFSMLKAHPIGIHSQLAVAGDIHHQFCILQSKHLCEITDGIVAVKGYNHLLHNVDGEIVLAFNLVSNDLWIGY